MSQSCAENTTLPGLPSCRYVPHTLSRVIQAHPNGLPLEALRSVAWQLLQALSYMHKHNVSGLCTCTQKGGHLAWSLLLALPYLHIQNSGLAAVVHEQTQREWA